MTSNRGVTKELKVPMSGSSKHFKIFQTNIESSHSRKVKERRVIKFPFISSNVAFTFLNQEFLFPKLSKLAPYNRDRRFYLSVRCTCMRSRRFQQTITQFSHTQCSYWKRSRYAFFSRSKIGGWRISKCDISSSLEDNPSTVTPRPIGSIAEYLLSGD